MSVVSYWLAVSLFHETHVLAYGCCCLSDSVAVCLISFVFPLRVSGVSPRGFFSQDFFDAFHSAGILFVILGWWYIFVSLCLLSFNLIYLPPSLPLFLSVFISQTFLSRETMTTVCARRHATWRATVKRCPLSRYPAKHRPSTLRRNSTKQSST